MHVHAGRLVWERLFPLRVLVVVRAAQACEAQAVPSQWAADFVVLHGMKEALDRRQIDARRRWRHAG